MFTRVPQDLFPKRVSFPERRNDKLPARSLCMLAMNAFVGDKLVLTAGNESAAWRAVCRSVHTWAVATALPGPTVRRHRGLRFAASLGTVLLAVIICAVLFRIVSVEYWRDPVTGWYIWASGTAFVLFGTLIFLDREQRANGLLLIVFGILEQGPWTDLMDSMPVWAIFLLELSSPLSWIVLAVVLLRFPEQRLEKRYERVFIAVMTAGS